MSTTPLVVGQSTLSDAPSTEGNTSVNAKASGVLPENQRDSISFPSLMKRIVPNDKGQITDGLEAKMLSPDDQVLNDRLSNIREPDGTLPPAGMFLPFILSQTASPDCIQLKGVPNGVTKATSAGHGAELASAAGYGVRGNLVASMQEEPVNAEAAKTKALTVGTDVLSSYSQVSNFNMATYGSHDTQNTGQTFMTDLGKIIADQHAGAVDSSHGIPDISNTNVNTSGLLLQGGEKINLGATAPSIAVPLQHSQWGDELSNRIMWMVRQEVQSASIKLNPPHLGPLEVKVTMANDQVNVSFTSHHAPVREALDASIPRLKEMLGDSGLQLGDANVTQRSFSEQNQTNQQQFSQNNNDEGVVGFNALGENGSEINHDLTYIIANGAIDIYA